jgi:methionyl-tRNA formyltransferase
VGVFARNVRIVFLGTPAIAVPALNALLEAGHDVALVVTQPDRPAGRSGTPLAPPVKQFAELANLTIEQPAKMRTRAFRERIGEFEPELLVVVAFGQMLSKRLLDQTPRGAINLHFSLLPKYRGAAPVQWALARGERMTGVTTMQVDERLDAGNILLQQTLDIEDGEHAPALFERLAEIGAPLLVRTLEQWSRGEIDPRSQAHDEATFAPLLTRADGRVDPARLEARDIEGRVRGFDPWPGVWLRRGDRRLRLVRATALQRGSDAEPGTLIADRDDRVALVCRGGTTLGVSEVQPDGRAAMAVVDALTGRQLALGERLEPVQAG